MDWRKKSIPNFFLDFVLGEIEEIEHMLKLADPRNPNVDLINIRHINYASNSCHCDKGISFRIKQGKWN